MRAATIRDGSVVVDEHLDPEPARGEILVRVHAAGLNGADMLQRKGAYPAPPGSPPDIPGLELAGEVVARGAGAERFSEGDRVMAVVGGGGQAELAVVHERAAMPVPDALDWPAAGGFPEVFTTAHDAVFTQAGLQAGERLLVHGAAGGVGTAACQLAAAYEARVIAVVSTPDKGEVARAAGADEVVLVDGFRDEVRRLTDGRGVDVVVDPVGGDRFTDSLRCLAREGRLVVLGFTGREIPTVKVNRLLLSNTTVMGAASAEFWRTEPGYAAQQWRDLVPLMQSGAIDPPIGSVFTLDQAAAAIREMDQRRAAGRLLLRVRGEEQR
jgi:NADPH:quinone reductase